MASVEFFVDRLGDYLTDLVAGRLELTPRDIPGDPCLLVFHLVDDTRSASR